MVGDSVASPEKNADVTMYSVLPRPSCNGGQYGFAKCLSQNNISQMWEKLDDAWGVAKGHAKWEVFNKSVEQRSAMKKSAVRVLPITRIKNTTDRD